MKDAIETMLTRKSIRAYTDEPVSQEDLDTILACGLQAPTAMNRQPWHFTVVKNRAILDKLSDQNKALMSRAPDENARKMAADPNFDSFRGAPVAIIVSGANPEQNTVADCANAVENMTLACHALGLGSCYLASFKVCLMAPDGPVLCNELGIPQGYIPMYALGLGHPAEDPEPKERNKNVVNYVE